MTIPNIGNKQPSSLRRHLIRGSLTSLVLKIVTALLNFITAVVLARTLSTEGFGIYAYCMSVVTFLTVPGLLGGQQLLVREIAKYHAEQRFGAIRGLIIRMRQASVGISCALAGCAAAAGWFVYGAKSSPKLMPFLIATTLIPPLVWVQQQEAMLRGLRFIATGQLSTALRPFLLLFFVGTIYSLSPEWLSPACAVTIQLVDVCLLFGLSFLILRRVMPLQVRLASPEFHTKQWAGSILPLMLAGQMQILIKEGGTLLLGLMKQPEAVAYFRIAQRGSDLIPFGLAAINMALAPTVSRLFAQGEMQRLQHLINKSILAVAAFSVPVAAVLIFGGKWLITAAFGAEYLAAYPVLAVLGLGQLINSLMGSNGLLLNMSGHEKYTLRAVCISALAGGMLSLVLIPAFGALGAAIATSCTLVLWNMLLARWLHRNTGIHTVFPSWLPHPQTQR